MRVVNLHMMSLRHCIVAALALSFSSVCAQTWKIYAAYGNHTQAAKVESKIFTVADGSLFSYDTADKSVDTYDKISKLSSFGIKSIASCNSPKCLVILYDDANIDLLGEKASYNIPDVKQTTMSDKTLNELRVFTNEAVISTNSGLVIVDLKNQNIKNLYDINQKIQSCIIQNGAIFVNTPAGIFKGDRKKNLLDKSNWESVAASTVDFAGYAQKEQKLNAELLEQVKDIKISGPKRNYFYRMDMDNDNKLVVAGGCFNYPAVNREGTIMTYQNGVWDAFDEESPKSFLTNKDWYQKVTDVIQVPGEKNHYFASAACTGLYEFKDGKCVAHYDHTNSPLTSILPDNPNAGYYVRITGLSFDKDGNLWMCNNECKTIVRVMHKDGKWSSYAIPQIEGFQTFDQTVFDERGWAWINSRRSTAAGHRAGLLVISPKGTVGAENKERFTFVSSLVNDDGTNYTGNFSLLNCIAEDLSGRMWIGTNQGIFYLSDPKTVYNPSITYSQPKVPRNDGTNLADYLLNEVPVKCITVDGANRKWIGTSSNGVYLVNEDGSEILKHFTKSNSPLISDNIYTIAIDGRTGEILIGTDKGLCSYISDYADPVEKFNKDLIKVYPNPVRPEYEGSIQITGLQLNSYVKIISANGRVVHSGKSIGGKYTWDRSLDGGGRAASGIYYILAADSEGKEGVAGKFLIVR